MLNALVLPGHSSPRPGGRWRVGGLVVGVGERFLDRLGETTCRETDPVVSERRDEVPEPSPVPCHVEPVALRCGSWTISFFPVIPSLSRNLSPTSTAQSVHPLPVPASPRMDTRAHARRPDHSGGDDPRYGRWDARHGLRGPCHGPWEARSAHRRAQQATPRRRGGESRTTAIITVGDRPCHGQLRDRAPPPRPDHHPPCTATLCGRGVPALR